ncbi:SUMF1/EgtB/PvdO family nonheme iron enzyme [Flammeovirga sp. MY04]|uniref:SUMF1/EgtB/PvdO family nonheme iron enzyme n=1 Tax=Flammeovirga sp. MY04 TaxID=1191459 RepID=UPI0008061F43|nr:SUMF1/EgtB/PvdO family nonheme iron enzyme [Flammeovirga sp. MY04]ANQ51717.1 SUMF1/EgtB/PvdO family nonheme iron enzyme [Flammeovirga sp. MY04]
MMNKTTLYFYLLLIICPFLGEANNIKIENVALTNKNTNSKTVEVNFDLSWDNSWRVSSAQSNWDAVWVFVKYRNLNTDYWQHATLSLSGHNATGATIDNEDDTGNGYSKGAFVYSASNISQQTVNYNVSLSWAYGEDHQGDDDTFEINVYGIEMVYVPQGRFALGTGGNEASSFYTFINNTSNRANPYYVSSEEAIDVGETAGNLCYVTNVNSGEFRDGVIAEDFPKGYQSFYCMKYEITQGQFVDFLNTLTSLQTGQNDFVKNKYGTNRNSIQYVTDQYVADAPYLPYVHGSHLAIFNYLDWACLRPMSEFEFEKACRGTKTPVHREFAWGESTYNPDDFTVANLGAFNEEITANYSTTLGNAAFSETLGNVGGPIRVGITATSTSDRIQSGASYYGIMDLSGSAFEAVVIVSSEEGRKFDGSHGNGLLSNIGNYTIDGWPQLIEANEGAGIRGGSYVNTNDQAYVSTRGLAAICYPTNSGRDFVGGRGVRTAPKN